ncbi:MAG: GNAT family N-acetyltransferase [Akkermansiaceae bacterium]|nr:GNAT family N-acetyltransferase [Armatimonadota bacterium]
MRNQNLYLVEIKEDGTFSEKITGLSDIAKDVCRAFVAIYKETGFQSPWTGYLAVRDGEVVGICGFKSPPIDGTVEISYFTFQQFENQGIATDMARMLLGIAHRAAPEFRVIAHSLAEENASAAILRKAGFTDAGIVEDPEDGPVRRWLLGKS